MASLDTRWSDDTGCTPVTVVQHVFFLGGGGNMLGPNSKSGST